MGSNVGHLVSSSFSKYTCTHIHRKLQWKILEQSNSTALGLDYSGHCSSIWTHNLQQAFCVLFI